MKLLAKTNRHYLVLYFATLVVSSGALFLGVRGLFDHFVDERLTQLEAEIITYVEVHNALPAFFQSTSAKLSMQPCDPLPVQTFGDTLIFNEIEQEEEPFRRLRFGLQIGDESYQVDLLQSALETEDIAEMFLLLNLVLIVAMFVVLFWAQKRMSERLWQPFYDTLERLRTFRLTQSEPLMLPSTDTDEFAELNATLERLTEKTRQDYRSLKRFTENASHEIQTPLAIIRAKLETLLQSEGLNDAQLAHLHGTQRAAARLSRLQQSLLLLVKIENNQFETLEQVDLKRLVQGKLELLEDFIMAKDLQIQVEMTPVWMQINPFLAETLVGNLVGNAVKHNLQKRGWLKIQLNDYQLIVTNSGIAPESPAIELVERFRRGDSQAEGLGLGLSIVKEICEKYGWTLDIGFEEGIWSTTIQFSNF
jgi:signal transduction histidine kinase